MAPLQLYGVFVGISVIVVGVASLLNDQVGTGLVLSCAGGGLIAIASLRPPSSQRHRPAPDYMAARPSLWALYLFLTMGAVAFGAAYLELMKGELALSLLFGATIGLLTSGVFVRRVQR